MGYVLQACDLNFDCPIAVLFSNKNPINLKPGGIAITVHCGAERRRIFNQLMECEIFEKHSKGSEVAHEMLRADG